LAIEDLADEGNRFPAVPGSRSDRPADGTTILSDQHGRRQPANHESARKFLVLIEQHGKIDAEMAEKLLGRTLPSGVLRAGPRTRLV